MLLYFSLYSKVRSLGENIFTVSDIPQYIDAKDLSLDTIHTSREYMVFLIQYTHCWKLKVDGVLDTIHASMEASFALRK